MMASFSKTDETPMGSGKIEQEWGFLLVIFIKYKKY